MLLAIFSYLRMILLTFEIALEREWKWKSVGFTFILKVNLVSLLSLITTEFLLKHCSICFCKNAILTVRWPNRTLSIILHTAGSEHFYQLLFLSHYIWKHKKHTLDRTTIMPEKNWTQTVTTIKQKSWTHTAFCLSRYLWYVLLHCTMCADLKTLATNLTNLHNVLLAW